MDLKKIKDVAINKLFDHLDKNNESYWFDENFADKLISEVINSVIKSRNNNGSR